MFISIEGLDGSGKTTQALRLYNWLRTRGHDVLLTREPGGTRIGEQIRTLLHDLDNKAMQPATELLLYNASRAQLVAEELRPQLARGGLVLSDRYADSTLAYQGYGHGQDLGRLRSVIQAATGGLQPDVTLFLDISPQAALTRRRIASLFGEEWNRLDDQALAFHQRVYEGYQELARAEPERWLRVDAGAASAEVLHLRLREQLAGRLPQPNAV